MIRVLVVEDSPLIARLLSSILNKTSDIEVVGIAMDGEQAVKMTQQLKPDLVTMDIKLPKMDGYEATKRIMAYQPTPILVVSSNSYTQEMNMAFNAIYYGALDMIEKGELENHGGQEDFSKLLVEKVRLLSNVKVIHHPMAKLESIPGNVISREVSHEEKQTLQTFIVGVAASTGGPQIVHTFLKDLPVPMNFAVLLVQHIVPAFAQGFVEWLAQGTQKDVRLALSGEEIKAGRIYVAPGNHHMKITRDGKILLSNAPAYKGHRPSANVMFQSLAENAEKKCLGVIMSGMGSDGLEGLKELRKKNAVIIAQDEATCVVFGMPKVCIDEGIVTSVVPGHKIAAEVMKYR